MNTYKKIMIYFDNFLLRGSQNCPQDSPPGKKD
jgi:hypothetical protein